MSDFVEIVCGILVLAMLVTATAFATMERQKQLWQTETVERGLAIYCPQDGKWAWKGECDE